MNVQNFTQKENFSIRGKTEEYLGIPGRVAEVFFQSGLENRKIAQRLGVDDSAISRYLSGVQCPSTDTLIRICANFGVSADYLLLGKGSLQPPR